MEIGHGVQQPADVCGVTDDARQPEHGHRRIVGVDAQADVPLPADGHHSLEEIAQMLAQLRLAHPRVGPHQGAELLHGRTSAAQRTVDETLGLGDDRVHELRLLRFGNAPVQRLDPLHHLRREILFRAFPREDLDVEIREAEIVEIEGEGPVRHRALQVGAHPVDDGHEVVADGVDPAAAERFEAQSVVFEEGVPLRAAVFDLFADRQALHHRPAQAGGLDARLQRADFRLGPDLPGGEVVQGRHDSLHPDLPQHLQGDGVGRAEPAPGFLHHKLYSSKNKVRKNPYLC